MPTLQEEHYGIVTDNRDPDKRGRLKVKSQSLVGADFELPDWVEPACHPFTSVQNGGALFLPLIGSTVELTVDVRDVEYDQTPGERFLQNPSVKWRAATPSTTDGPMPLPASLQADYPNSRGWATPAGHEIILHDGGGLTIKSSHGHVIELVDGEIRITNQGQTIIKSPTKLGVNATELMVLGNLFMALFNAHVHPTGVGPSGPPTPLMTVSQLSQEGNAVR